MKKTTLITAIILSLTSFSNITNAKSTLEEKEAKQELVAITVQYASFYYLQDIYCKKKANKDDETYQELKKNYEKLYNKASKSDQKMIDEFLPKIFNHLDSNEYKDKKPPKSSKQCKAMYEKLEDTFKRVKKNMENKKEEAN